MADANQDTRENDNSRVPAPKKSARIGRRRFLHGGVAGAAAALAPGLSFSSIVRNAMNRQAQRPVAQYSLDGGAPALRPAPAFLRFGASLLGPGARSILA